MRKIIARVKKIRMTRWSKLTSGEKVICVMIGLLKWLVIAGLILAGLGLVAVIMVSLFVTSCIVSSISGGFNNASHAYRPGDRNVRFW